MRNDKTMNHHHPQSLEHRHKHQHHHYHYYHRVSRSECRKLIDFSSSSSGKQNRMLYDETTFCDSEVGSMIVGGGLNLDEVFQSKQPKSTTPHHHCSKLNCHHQHYSKKKSNSLFSNLYNQGKIVYLCLLYSYIYY